MKTVGLGLLGAGRIGLTHARSVTQMDGVELLAVHDPSDDAASPVIGLTGARNASVEEILADEKISGVIIATPTALHVRQIEQAATAGKAIFCEKPIDLDLARAEACVRQVEALNVPLMIGFNRRFDPSFQRLKQKIDNGEIGAVELVQITSRDPAPPPIDYLKGSGGLFRDMMIHDLDMARFLVDDPIAEVMAQGSVLVDPEIGATGDIDTAAVTLRTRSGTLVVITNSRRASYGYDQRIEVHGAQGMISAGNPTETTVAIANRHGVTHDPLNDFFMQRYADAYRLELHAFCELLRGKPIAYPNGADGVAALRLAEAALQSSQTGHAVQTNV